MNDFRSLAVTTRNLAKDIECLEAARLALAVEKSFDRETFHLAVLGEFKRGKSSLINSLLHKDLLPTDNLPTTAVMTVVEYGEKEGCTLTWQDGRVEEWPCTQDSLARLAVGGDVDATEVLHLVVRLDCLLLKDGLVIIDTPGVNELSQSRAEVTYGVLPHCDAAIFLLDAVAPVKKSEADFLVTKVLSQRLNTLLFVIAKADRLDTDELHLSMTKAQQKLDSVLGVPASLLPYSAKWVDGTYQRGEEHPHRCQLLSHIRPMRDQAEAASNERRIARLHEALLHIGKDIEVIESLRNAQDEQVRAFQEKMADAQRSQNASFERLIASIETVGRQTLHKLVESSCEKLRHDAEIEFARQIQLQDSNLEKLWQQVLPIQIERQLRMFAEAKGREIQIFFDKFTEHVGKEYTKHFQQPLRMQMSQAGMEIPEWHAQLGSGGSSVSSPLKMATERIMPVGLGAVVGSFIMPGIGTIIGSMAGQVFGNAMQKKKTDTLRVQLLAELPLFVRDIVGENQRNIHQVIDRWFDQMIDAVKTYHSCQEQNLKKRIMQRLSPPAVSEISMSAEQLTGVIARYKDLHEQLSECESNQG